MLPRILPNTTCVIYFWKADAKSSSMVMQGMSHVTIIKLPRSLPKTPCVIYFWKALAKFSSMVMQKTSHVACDKCYMSQILCCQEFYQRPQVLYIFGILGSRPPT